MTLSGPFITIIAFIVFLFIFIFISFKLSEINYVDNKKRVHKK